MRVKSGWKEILFLCRNQILSTLRLSPKKKGGLDQCKSNVKIRISKQ